MIEKFENQDSFLQDLKQTKEINKFSEKSQELIADMNNTEIFELCETSSKQQFPDCKQALSVVFVDDAQECRKVLRRSTRATTMSCQYLAMLSRRITGAAPDMDLLNDNECSTRLKNCCIKLVKKSMENTHPFLRDGITTANTESLCQKLDCQRSKKSYMTEPLWRIIHSSQQELREFEIQNIGF